MMNCPICDEHKNLESPLWESGSWLLRPAGKNLNGYLYLEAKTHVESWAELSLDQLNDYGSALYFAFQNIKKLNPEKIYQVAISEKVPHLHLHLVPRYVDHSKGLDHLTIALGEGFPKL